MNFKQGAWLGVDIGSSKSKVANFCLVEVDAAGTARVTFERGQARALVNAAAWPGNAAAEFLSLDRSSWLTERVEEGVGRILSRSTLVERWRAGLGLTGVLSGAAVDAPCGFASAGSSRRDTEAHAANSFPTPDEVTFVASMRRFADAGNETPLRQRYYWKLVGLLVLRELLSAASILPPHAPVASIARACTDGAREDARTDGGFSLPVANPTLPRIREAFPSDTFARANGELGVLAPESRELLEHLVAAPWDLAGNVLGRASSTPSPSTHAQLLRQQQDLQRELRSGERLPSMRKVPNDPSWADLWDAFACAFVAVCEANGAAALAGSDIDRVRAEGAIVMPAFLASSPG